jgi:hypothetical protein
LTHQILLELTYFDLEGRTNSSMGPERKQRAGKVKMNNMTFIPMQSNGVLKVGANTTSNNGHDYWTTMVFTNVNYLQEGDADQDAYEFNGNDGTEYKIQRLPRNTQVKVNCSCLDFHYRFAVWDDRFRSLDGNPPPPYVKHSNRPSVNPTQSPGVCKHIMSMMDDLRSERLFV